MGGNRDEGEESNGNPLIYFAVATVLELVFGILAAFYHHVVLASS